MPHNIIITSMKAGAGHIKAAEAIHAAFAQRHPGDRVRNIDLLDYTSPAIKFLYGKPYLEVLKRFPGMYAHNYKNYQPVQAMIKPRILFDQFNFAPFLSLVEKAKPDCIIATHFIPALVLEHYRKAKRRHYHIAVSLTDYEAHPLWFVHGANAFSVGTEEMRYCLSFAGIDPNIVQVARIPVHPKFLKKHGKQAMRKKYHLGSEAPVLLITAGSLGATPLEEMISAFRRIKQWFQIIVVCGTNAQLKEKLEHMRKTEPRLASILGFTDAMEELMAASDLLITKPGGMTVTESMVAGLPMILTDPIPGQEEANAYYLVGQGVAMRAGGLASLLYVLDVLLRDSNLRAKMVRACKRAAKPNAAFRIADQARALLPRR